MSNFGSYSGTDLMKLELKKRDWLVESLIRKKDSVIIVGDAKAGKTLFKQQLICSLTSGHPFLDKYNVAEPCCVTDIQLEGELEDTQDRFKRMTATIDFTPANYHLLFEAPLQLQTKADTKRITYMIGAHENHVPDIIFIDPVYFAFTGSLSEDAPVRMFLGNLRNIKETFDCAIVLLHHTHKIRINFNTGELIDEGDQAMFGSAFFRAFPDHIIMLVHDKKNNLRIMSCATQRSGTVITKNQLRLVEPDPLYFEEVELQPTREELIEQWLVKVRDSGVKGLSVEELMNYTKLGRATVYRSLKILHKTKRVEKTGEKPVKYSLIEPVGETVC